MKTLRLILREFLGLFVDDGSLAVALLVLVAFAAGLRQFEPIPDMVAALVLVVGALLVLVENVLRRARRHAARKRFTAMTTAVILLPVLGMGGWAAGIQLFDNFHVVFHVVEPGALDRSAFDGHFPRPGGGTIAMDRPLDRPFAQVVAGAGRNRS